MLDVIVPGQLGLPGAGIAPGNKEHRVVLRYRFPRAFMTASYEKFLSQGSGIFAGADAQIAELTVRRPLWRTYELLTECGY